MRTTLVDVCLPTHPTLRHPRTGEPLRAVGVGRRGPIWPILGGDGTGSGGEQGGQGAGQGGTGTGGQNTGGQGGTGGAGGQGGGEGAGQQTGAGAGGQDGTGGTGSGADDDRGYPANTPVAEMSPAQQTAYWKFHARKHENAFKGLGLAAGQESAELQRLRERDAALKERENAELSDTERLTKERDEFAVELQQLRTESVRRQALDAANAAAEKAGWAGRLTADDLEFITEVEPDKAIEQAKKLAARLGRTGAGNKGAGGGHDQGYRRQAPVSGAEAGRAEAQRRFGKTAQTNRT